METLLSVGLSNAVLAIALALVVAVLAWLCRQRPAVVHALWLLVLLRFLLPPLWTQSLPPSVVSRPAVLSEKEPVDVDALLASLPKEPARPQQEAPAIKVPEPTTNLHGGADEGPAWTWAGQGMLLVLSVWLAGALSWWLLAAVRLARFHRQLRVAWPAPAPIQEQALRLARRMGINRCPRVWLVPAGISPLLLALGLRPRLLLPVRLWERLSQEQQDTILAHELAHLRRGDPWVRRLELVVLGLYWWHPVAWWAQRQLHEAEEQCCDRWVLRVLPGAAASYATTLVETMAYLSGCRGPAPVAASGLGQVDSLKRRLTMILRDDTLRPLPRSALVVLGLVLLGVPLLPGWAEPPRNRATGPEDAGPTAPALHRSAPRTPFSSESLPVGTQTGNAASVEDLRDEIEVMRAQVAQAEADLKGKAAYLEYRNKQYERMQQLVQRGAVEERLADQERDRRDAAQAARDAAEGQVNVQRTKLKLAERRLERHQGQPGQGAQELRDTVELLEAQVQVRQAELKAADAALQAASREVKRLKVMAAQGVVDARVLENQQARQETCQAELEVKKASLLEPIIRLKQARRRLEKLEPGKKGTTDRKGPDTTSMKPKGPGQEKETKPGTSSTTAPSRSDKGQAERMQELEKKLKEVTEELNALRRDLGGSKTPPRRAGK